MTPGDHGWIRQLSLVEKMLEVGHQHNFMLTCYCLTLNSKQPLQEEHVRDALFHLLRKIPSLKVCLRSKSEGDIWFHEMEDERIDFKILENFDFQQEYYNMTVHQYDTYNGPLWCARLLPLPRDTTCAMPEIKNDFPHQYYFLFGFHHSITDGTSSVAICGFFLDLLNDVISERPIDDLEPLAEHVSDEQTMKVFEEVSQEIERDPSVLESYRTLLKGRIEDIPFLKAYPPPHEPRARTLNMNHSLSMEETLEFIRRCKKEGVTIHSGFFSVVNAALVEMLTQAGVKEDIYEIKHYHTMNYRRYWKGDTSKAFGAHLGKFTLVSRITDDIHQFWDNARQFHSEMKELLKNRQPIKEVIAMLEYLPFSSDMGKVFDKMPRGDTYYGTTNMGNLSSTFSGEGNHVQVTDFRRTTSTFNNLCSHVIQTFRGRFLYGLDYDCSVMSEETARFYIDTIFKVLKIITKTKTN